MDELSFGPPIHIYWAKIKLNLKGDTSGAG